MFQPYPRAERSEPCGAQHVSATGGCLKTPSGEHDEEHDKREWVQQRKR